MPRFAHHHALPSEQGLIALFNFRLVLLTRISSQCRMPTMFAILRQKSAKTRCLLSNNRNKLRTRRSYRIPFVCERCRSVMASNQRRAERKESERRKNGEDSNMSGSIEELWIQVLATVGQAIDHHPMTATPVLAAPQVPTLVGLAHQHVPVPSLEIVAACVTMFRRREEPMAAEAPSVIVVDIAVRVPPEMVDHLIDALHGPGLTSPMTAVEVER